MYIIRDIFLLFLDLEYRLDFQLKEGKMESTYLATLTSHTSYWSNCDVALFVLSRILGDYQK